MVADWIYEVERERYGTDEDDSRYYVCEECGKEVYSDDIHEGICNECRKKLEDDTPWD